MPAGDGQSDEGDADGAQVEHGFKRQERQFEEPAQDGKPEDSEKALS